METQINTQSDGISFLAELTTKIAPVLEREIDLIGTPELTDNAENIMNSLKLIKLNQTIYALNEKVNLNTQETMEVDNNEFTKMMKELEATQQKNHLKEN